MNSRQFFIILTAILFSVPADAGQSGKYKNFTVSVYTRAQEVQQMGDVKKLEAAWDTVARQLQVDKIYLETHRDNTLVDEKTLETAKNFFQAHGIQTAGGITYTRNESNHYETFCYSNPENRKKVQEIAELTAKHFDEFILDDFFFTSCKCDLCIKAKGNRSWTQFRLELMKNAARDLVINPAKAVNPKVKVVIKYPNWYEHFQGLGFNLEAEPALFDGIYTGTETRDPVRTDQHLQQYESYLIFRYLEHLKPGKNGGGWVDPGAMVYLDRYAEQLWLTMFAKAPEITLFDYRQIKYPVRPNLKAEWQGSHTSFDWDDVMKSVDRGTGEPAAPITIARPAGYCFEQVDKFLDQLGTPVGIKSYRPYHAVGEDFLQNYFGMIGIPMDVVPEFPLDGNMIILTESAKFDQQIVEKIKSRLVAGKNVTITSGLLRALQGKGIEDIVELRSSDRKAIVKDFVIGRVEKCQSREPILFPQIDYFTNDSWMDISCVSGPNGWPVLHQASYSRGYLFVLAVPDNYADLYNLPQPVLNRIRGVLSQDINVRLDAPSQVSLFVYDNNSFIVESFLPEVTSVKILVDRKTLKIQDMITKEELTTVASTGDRMWGRPAHDQSYLEIKLQPHSYKVFKLLY